MENDELKYNSLKHITTMGSLAHTYGNLLDNISFKEYYYININNAANNIQNVAQQAQQNIDAAVTDAKIYSKQLPVAPVQQTAVDIVKNDTLQTIILKINNFIQRFKYATGVWIANNP